MVTSSQLIVIDSGAQRENAKSGKRRKAGCAVFSFAVFRSALHSRPQSLRSLWPAAGIESSGSNHFEITKEITEFCPSGFT